MDTDRPVFRQVTPGIEVLAPAKINLGLEVLGKRPDGFHEIRSVLHGITLADSIVFTPQSIEDPMTGTGMPAVPIEQNLINRALMSCQQLFNLENQWNWSVRKCIPEAAGLGGGSSDAAATLMAMQLATTTPVSSASVRETGALLGSDVPFFLGPLVARVTGRGEVVQTLDVPVAGWAVILISPRIRIPNKTTRLYGLLNSEDLSDGTRTNALIEALLNRQPINRSLLGNAFTAPLYRLEPRLAEIAAALDRMKITLHGLSGAGPTHFALVRSEEVQVLSDEIRRALGVFCDIMPTELRRAPIRPRWMF